VPSKLFGIMAAGRASLFVGPEEAEVGRVLDETGGGLRFEIGDAAGLASAIRGFAEDPSSLAAMSRRALEAARSVHHHDRRLEQWAEMLEAVAGVQSDRAGVAAATGGR
ncbi:MAG: hypothetical protein AAFX76_07975, partial [Planctomycetota bacterium]